MFRDAEFRQQLLAVDHFVHHLQAHLMQLAGYRLQLLDLCQRKLIISVLAPVRLAVHGVEAKAIFGGFFTPVGTFCNRQTLHA